MNKFHIIGLSCLFWFSPAFADYKIILNSENIKLSAPKELVAPSDCLAIIKHYSNAVSGVYRIYPEGGEGFEVYCDMETDGGGWTVFQRRFNGSVDFYRDWESYKNGFGSVSGEYWLGNEKIHRLTISGKELAVRLWDENNYGVARYSNFKLGDSASEYELTVSGHDENSVPDALLYHSGSKFSTYDRDNDGQSSSCSVTYHGAWWF
jgi:ficolin